MSSIREKPDGITEECEECRDETPHDISIEILTESPKRDGNEKFSREPYRIATCVMCGHREKKRMNNA